MAVTFMGIGAAVADPEPCKRLIECLVIETLTIEFDANDAGRHVRLHDTVEAAQRLHDPACLAHGADAAHGPSSCPNCWVSRAPAASARLRIRATFVIAGS